MPERVVTPNDHGKLSDTLKSKLETMQDGDIIPVYVITADIDYDRVETHAKDILGFNRSSFEEDNDALGLVGVLPAEVRDSEATDVTEREVEAFKEYLPVMPPPDVPCSVAF